MALTHATAVRNDIADAVVDLVDAGSTDLTGDLVIMTSGDVEVATLALSDPAFGAAASGTATANAVADDASATGGTAALFKIQNRDNVEIFRGTVTGVGGGGDIELTGGVVIGAGTTVSMSSFSYSASA
ncbi:MAG: hypothetical protein L3J58_11800 [Emcibacter sp.]|nr:hypothetical protein [Emcibacter sp.]